MTYLAIVLSVATVLLLLVLLLRKPAAQVQDPRLALIPDQLARFEAATTARSEALSADLRSSLGQLRSELGVELQRARDAADQSAATLRTEVSASITTLGTTLTSGLSSFREDNAASAEALRRSVAQSLEAISQRVSAFAADQALQQTTLREALNTKLNELTASNTSHQERLRTTVEGRLDQLNAANAAKLEEMRATVDEKLQSTLQTRLTESFGQVTDQLTKVHSGLGEMTKLSEGVNDLSRIFTNVKSRGGFAEVQLGMLLEQMLAPGQFIRNARVKGGTQEVVEFAVRFPGAAGETLLPIDAKFPREDWERLESAYGSNDAATLSLASRAFEAAIRTEGKRICDKYINPPVTTPHAIMFLPTEGLYAEVMRRDALQAEIQSKYQVTIAGPSTLSAILTSFQMGFHMLAIQQKGGEVWKVLEATKTEFKTFETLMGSMEKQVGTVQNTIEKLGVRTRAINRTLRDVSVTDSAPGNVLSFDGVVPSLAASTEGE